VGHWITGLPSTYSLPTTDRRGFDYRTSISILPAYAVGII